MNYRIIKYEEIKNAVKSLLLDCNFNLSDDITCELKSAYEKETSQIGRSVLNDILENNNIARNEKLPICQDTGMVVFFVEYGDKVLIEGGNFENALNSGVKEAYEEGYLRKSIVNDPLFERVNTNTNTPAVIHTEIKPSKNISILACCKGFGSENMSAIKMLTPFEGKQGVKNFVLDTIKKAGVNPCPPIIVGVGIGGTFEMAAILAKKATCRNIKERNKVKNYMKLEKELLNDINNMGIGPAGLGGNITALAVNIETFATHIAGLPVAVNICCHASRHKTITI